MTAAAITNLFPGSPPVTGENITTSGTASGKSDFDNLLGATEMASAQHGESLNNNDQAANPFKDLFAFLNLLWGNGDNENGSQPLSLTSKEGQYGTEEAGSSDAKENAPNPGTDRWSNGFISQLQMILTMFQELAMAFQGDSSSSVSSQSPTVPLESGLLEAPSNEAATSAYMVSENPQIQSASMSKVVAPGINLAETGLSETVENEPNTTWQGDINQKSNIPFPGNPDGAKADSDRASQTAATQPSGRQTGEPGSRIAEQRQSSENDLDLHLMTVTYSKGRGLNISDLRYSGSGRFGQRISNDQRLSFIDTSQDSQDESIQMAKASIKTDHGNLEMQTLHVSPDLLKGRLSTSSPVSEAQNNQTSTINAKGDEALTIDFNNNQNQEPGNNQNGDEGQSTQQFDQRRITPSSITAIYRNDIDIDTSANVADNNLDDLVTTQVREGISQALKMNKNRAVLHLNPPELGSVKVNITVSHNNHVQASFVADHPETRHILEANMQQLRDSLSQNGFSMSQVNVDVSGGFSQWTGAQQEKLTPFGYPTSLLTDRNDGVEEVTTSRTTGIRPDGVHIIA